ncbi:MAG: hypothetical protein J6R18_01500, partial [Kiritimatiellae bacterium]|nr:hypothetical protein [Kiritimatiellia bacterium]
MKTELSNIAVLMAAAFSCFAPVSGFDALAEDAKGAYVQPREGHFERMMFNNPGLEVDLSLGI